MKRTLSFVFLLLSVDFVVVVDWVTFSVSSTHTPFTSALFCLKRKKEKKAKRTPENIYPTLVYRRIFPSYSSERAEYGSVHRSSEFFPIFVFRFCALRVGG